MPDLQFAIETRDSAMERVIRATPRIVLGLAFISIGLSKLGAHSTWVSLFQRLGVGDWFRYFTGGMQIAGGALAVFRRTTIAGAAAIACTMAGAVVADLFVLHVGILAIVPFILLAFAIGVAVQEWART